MQHERLPETHAVGIIGAHGVGKSDRIYRVWAPPSLHQETTNSRVPPASHRVFLRGL